MSVRDVDTICWKINRIQDMLAETLRTQELEIPDVVKLMNDIQIGAGKLERALKRRKRFMVDHGLEAEYKKNPKYQAPKKDIRNTFSEKEERKDKPSFEVIIKDNGKIRYQQPIIAGVICLVERIEDIDEQGMIDGQTQKLVFGDDLHAYYAFDQLYQAIRPFAARAVVKLKEFMKKSKTIEPDFKKRFLDRLNKS